MRLFVAVRPPSLALAELESAVAPLRARWPGVRWSGTDTWHVTLAFLGEVAPERLPELSARLERAAARHQASTLAIGRAGAFPAAGRARIVWAGIDGDREPLARLAASVAAGARRAGAPPPDEGRRFRPHLTLGRCKDPADLRELIAELAGFGGTPWQATRVELVRSLGGPRPEHHPIGSWPLRTRVE